MTPEAVFAEMTLVIEGRPPKLVPRHCDACFIEKRSAREMAPCCSCNREFRCEGCMPTGDLCKACGREYCLDCGGEEPICNGCWVKTKAAA